jgi:hypothetical protein
MCMFCQAEIDIGFPENTDTVDVYLTFYDGVNMERIVDAASNVRLNQDGFAEFAIHDAVSGFEGVGDIRLQQDQIVVNLKLNGGPEKAQDIFSSQRTFVRDPYREVSLADPIELAKQFCGSCGTFRMKLEPGVEWHEGIFLGKYLEVVNAFSYEFNDSEYETYHGLAVYNIMTGKVDQIFKSSDSDEDPLPTDFKW